MWSTGTGVRLHHTSTGHAVDIIVDASFVSNKSRPLLLSPISRPFSRFRPPFSKKKNSAEHGSQAPVCTDGRVVGKDSLWLVRLCSENEDATGKTPFACCIESVACPGVFLSVSDEGRVMCVKTPPLRQTCQFVAAVLSQIAPLPSASSDEAFHVESSISDARQQQAQFVATAKPPGSDGTGSVQHKDHQHKLSASEIKQFAHEGYLVIRNAVPKQVLYLESDGFSLICLLFY